MELKLENEEFTRYGWITDIDYTTRGSMRITFFTDEWVTFFENLEFDDDTNVAIDRRMPNRYVKTSDNSHLKIDFYGFQSLIEGGPNQYVSDNLYYDDIKCEKYLVDTDPVIQNADNTLTYKGLWGFGMGTSTPTADTPAYYIYALILPNSDDAPPKGFITPFSNSMYARKVPSGAFIAPCTNSAGWESSGTTANSYSDIASLPNTNILGIFMLPIPPLETNLSFDVGTDNKKTVGVYGDSVTQDNKTLNYPAYPSNWSQDFVMNTWSTNILTTGIPFVNLRLNDTYNPTYSPLEYSPHVVEWKFTGITGESAAYTAPILNSGLPASQITDFTFGFDISITAGLAAWTWVPRAPIINNIKAFSYSTYFDAHIPNGASAWTNYMQNNKSQFNTSLLQNALGTGVSPFIAGTGAISAGISGARGINTAELAGKGAEDLAEYGALAGVGLAGFAGLGLIMGAAFKVANQLAQKHDLMRQAAQITGMTSGTALTNFQWLYNTVSGEGSKPVDYYVGIFSEWRIPANVLRQLHINSYMYGNPITELKPLKFIELQSREQWDVWFISNAQTALLRGNVAESVIDRVAARFKAGLRLWTWQEADGFDSVYNYDRMNWEIALAVNE